MPASCDLWIRVCAEQINHTEAPRDTSAHSTTAAETSWKSIEFDWPSSSSASSESPPRSAAAQPTMRIACVLIWLRMAMRSVISLYWSSTVPRFFVRLS